ncbi:hypothetical protein AWW72_18005 [Acinetobacter sp. NRRL B-65365]|uniref:hypothetical protein n=1 Tax=Acinetobacter sp. NRRL B-65365 TaxID=1785092 RepID=UPI00079FE06B|nr:hypothetical protein [Acinetobacter sp. NRRL B-65365]KYQ82500.1 hypothetical protein AWW72_18005 [Acinetobacter sp. NRRL B-65365]
MVDLRISEKQKPGIFRFHSLKVDLRTHGKAEVLKYFSQLGFYVTSTTSIIEGDEFLFVQDNGRVFSCENAISSDGYEWVTLDHLKDMVILNRNDVNDATHVMPDDGDKFVKLSDGWRYWTDDGMDAYGQYAFAWQKNGNSDEYLEANLRPIQKPKTTDHEFLDPENSYQYIKTTDVGIKPTWIEIPEGAHLYFMEWFYKLENGIWYAWMGRTKWMETEYQFSTDYANIHWVREGIKLPEPENKHAVESTQSFNPNINADYILLDGEAAKKAWSNGSKIQISPIKSIPEWEDLNVKVATLDFFEKKFLFRCKPHTIMLNGVELKPWNSVQVNYEKFQIRIDCADVESASHTYEEIWKVFSNRSVDWSNKA